MRLDRHGFGELLRAKLDITTEPGTIADWAHDLYLTHTSLDPDVYKVLMELVAMREGPEFVVEPGELIAISERFLAET